MNMTINAEDMLNLLQEYWTEAHKLIEDFGREDGRAKMHVGWCIGMKEMAEALIGVPVNLRKDGKVTIGFD